MKVDKLDGLILWFYLSKILLIFNTQSGYYNIWLSSPYLLILLLFLYFLMQWKVLNKYESCNILHFQFNEIEPSMWELN